MTNEQTRAFLVAGDAIFTVANPTDDRYTFRIRMKDAELFRPAKHFLSLLTGPDNTRDYTYMGVVEPETLTVRLTAKSRLTVDSAPVRVAQWALGRVASGRDFPAGYRLYHEGRCGHCGRVLSVPESIERGIGPDCFEMMMAAATRHAA